MISYISGTVVHSDPKKVVILTAGVGYVVYTHTSVSAAIGGTIELWTYLSVKENALELYGFNQREELDFFELLISISGIGPKSALNILSLTALPQLKRSIGSGDVGYLTKVSGIGKKNAEKIILELKDKVGNLEVGGERTSEDMDALEALLSLGYSERDAREALREAEGTTSQEKIRSALRQLHQ